ncbi:fibronectin [Ruminococcus albus SY3]|uniref:Fibronectin n=1 Tax=Ruminococcus albus SY3 TaxID=1341156 RepID=A0A011WTX8_RUMAL|nr:leucine-rich repeat domain-containing protein [Ruminococcus albus]EXM40455.1 fibronectin [Ruminococcus albus SY3]
MANKIMKSTLASVLAIMSVAASVPGTAIGNVISDTAITASANVVSGSFATEELPDGTLCITKFEGTGSVIDIPDKLDGKTVTKIGDKAFMGNEYVTEIYFSNYITSVGEFAFCNCTALKSVYCSNSVKSIGRGAFANCVSLTEILNLGGLETIEEGTFQKCTSLENIYFPSSVKSIGAGAFQECTNLKEVYFDGTTIGKKAFYNCENLSTIDMNDVVDIEDYAFFGCTSLNQINPYEVKTIGNSAFGSCTGLTKLNLVPFKNLTSIGNDAFANCKNLKEVSLSENLTTLGKRAFANCHALNEIEIFSDKLTTIPMGAFATTGITTIAIPEGVTSIDGAAFNSCKSLEYVKLPSTLKTIGAKAFDNTGVKNVTYNGVKGQWNKIEIGEGNDVLESAEKLFITEAAYPNVSREIIYDSVKLSWTAVNGAEKYGIIEKIDGEWVMLGSCSGALEITVGDLQPGWHDFAVIAMIDGEWIWDEEDENSSYSTAYAYISKPTTYPEIKSIDYNEPTHQIRFTWEKVKDADRYGIAVYLAGKWRVQVQNITGTVYTTPKNLTPGKTYKVAIAARVNGKWDVANAIKNAVNVTVK